MHNVGSWPSWSRCNTNSYVHHFAIHKQSTLSERLSEKKPRSQNQQSVLTKAKYWHTHILNSHQCQLCSLDTSGKWLSFGPRSILDNSRKDAPAGQGVKSGWTVWIACKDGFQLHQAWLLDVDTRVCCGCLKCQLAGKYVKTGCSRIP